ncbi:hypothetical protein HOE37_02050 [Candidatus Woesearchaeota archaeon]|jgi:hypothetical protein|nr:hypothetical protein [Candidatus Woesearchaeota archaeon]MBT4110617.1 hypothetical protein [Candidatus Woesearchaeota archaeon]MBT4335859.1 hypothetical protein [Candidatus Woesearchaeota archaeon]MBT4469162.1 hypothetical protein [Candidatus Woesearchaeota archaeon]MBT6744519.1 hypothetical protein [Candidatus Woesearchaeota archaeon]
MEKFNQFMGQHDFQNGTVISSDDLDELRKGGLLVEDFLDYLNIEHQLLLHGSHCDFDGPIKSNDEGIIYLTEFGSVALLKAVLSNEGTNLRYPTRIKRKHSFPITLDGVNQKTIKSHGYIYLVGGDDTYLKGQGNIELIKCCNGFDDTIPYVSKLEVLLSDLQERHKIILK